MNKLTRIGVFYEGEYFLHVSNYYNYHHPQKARINIGGLHALTTRLVAREEGVDEHLCRIIDAHYFRARVSEPQTDEHNRLYAERAFDDILADEGVVTHYLPHGPPGEEQRIEIWLALETYETAIRNAYDVVVLVASDSHYVPLARKLNGLGIRVMVLEWDFEATAANGQDIFTRTSRDLLREASYPVSMHSVIEDQIATDEEMAGRLFVSRKAGTSRQQTAPAEQGGELGELPRIRGPLMTIRSGYGFIERPPNNVFFHYTDLTNADFAELEEGDFLEFSLVEGGGRDGGDVAKDVCLIETETEDN